MCVFFLFLCVIRESFRAAFLFRGVCGAVFFHPFDLRETERSCESHTVPVPPASCTDAGSSPPGLDGLAEGAPAAAHGDRKQTSTKRRNFSERFVSYLASIALTSGPNEEASVVQAEKRTRSCDGVGAVSYTHLTLPTKA